MDTSSSCPSTMSSSRHPWKKSSRSKPVSSLSLPLEGKSSKEGAWFDVHSILQHRVNETGEGEVEVSFKGFSSSNNEWLDPHASLRLQSKPCDESDCVLVLLGDLVLCFQETRNQSLHFDAEVVGVKRRRHDVRGCRCRFLVKFYHDGTQHCVPLGKISRRPETESRAHVSEQKRQTTEDEKSKVVFRHHPTPRPTVRSPAAGAPADPASRAAGFRSDARVMT
ncbi:hypothetical protein R1flu_027466 [Riccia fluitans]|uniref:SAWADEE domain-containing protein n=1 Tax=Riccia fluitans TaxID=41844 RepID=A0ABD1XMX6_9MARC